VVPRTDPRGLTYHWLQFHREAVENAPDSETAVVHAGAVAVTPLRFERTNEDALAHLQDSLARQ
jgi:5'-nucleotidase